MQYRLYGYAGTRSIRVTWLLEELELQYDFIKALPQSPEILAVNSAGKIPTLLVDDEPISDSAAICLFLCDTNPNKGLSAPCKTIERAKIDSWLYFAQSELEPPIWANRKHNPSSPLSLIPKKLMLDMKDWADFEFAKSVKAMLERMGDNPYAMGENFTIVDIFLTQIGQWARFDRFDVPEQYREYIKRVWSRPALARARERESKK